MPLLFPSTKTTVPLKIICLMLAKLMQTCYDSAFTNPLTLSPPPMYGALVPQSMSWRTKMKLIPGKRHRNPLFCTGGRKMLEAADTWPVRSCRDQHPGQPAWLHPLLPQEVNTVLWRFSKLTAFLNFYSYLHAGFWAQWTKGWNDAWLKPRGVLLLPFTGSLYHSL